MTQIRDDDVLVIEGARTPWGRFLGGLRQQSATQLAITAARGAIERSALNPECIDSVILGNVLQTSSDAAYLPRHVGLEVGAPIESDALIVSRACGSALEATIQAAKSIRLSEANILLVGGTENMSLAPMALPKARWGHRMELTGIGDIYDLMVFDGLYEIFYGYHMGMTAENIARLYDISRQEQDELGVLSHTRARKAISDGLFAQEIVPVTIKSRKGDIVVDTDERPMDTSLEKMAELRPAFAESGSVTAGNASGINDGAAAVLMMSAGKARALGLEPIVQIKAFRSGGLDPAYMGLGPVPAIRRVMAATGMSLDDIDMIELNEAFASQAIGCMRELNIAVDWPNELGSGISIGHPIGCTGARQMVSGMNQMKRKGYTTGLISMCIGGGMGMAMVIER